MRNAQQPEYRTDERGRRYRVRDGKRYYQFSARLAGVSSILGSRPKVVNADADLVLEIIESCGTFLEKAARWATDERTLQRRAAASGLPLDRFARTRDAMLQNGLIERIREPGGYVWIACLDDRVQAWRKAIAGDARAKPLDAISKADAAELYGAITGVKPDERRIKREIEKINGYYTVRAVWQRARKIIDRRRAALPRPGGKYTCRRCGERTRIHYGAAFKLCRTCMTQRFPDPSTHEG